MVQKTTMPVHPAGGKAKRSHFETNPANNRSRMSNGSRLLRGADGRTAEGRRYRDLVAAYAADLGGFAELSEAERSLVREAASSALASEGLQAAVVRGEIVDIEQLVRLSNSTTRLVAKLVALRKPRKSSSPLVQHFANPKAKT